MQQLSPLEYIKIDAANQFGLDKETWDDRIKWFDKNLGAMKPLEADEPLLFQKALNAYYDALSGTPTGFIMGLDATASGLQIMAALIGCHQTGKAVNLIDTGKREDVYSEIGKQMGKERVMVKYPIMTYFYGSRLVPESAFGELVNEFYEALEVKLPGAVECMNDMQECWQPDALEHKWTLPDGHTSKVKVMVPVDKKIEIDEMENANGNHATFTHRAYINTPKETGLSLAANIVHSIDGYVVREMFRKAEEQGFELLAIHDSFWASPNYMQNVRENYVQILADIADSDLLQGILRQVTNSQVEYIKLSDNLAPFILKAEYALS